MNRLLVIAGLAGALALPMLAPGAANASCRDSKATGTVLGGVGGALIGNSISGGGGGAILGGLGGAVVGHQIAAGGCEHSRTYDRSGYRTRTSAYGRACHTETRSYYNDRGVLMRRSVQVCR